MEVSLADAAEAPRQPEADAGAKARYERMRAEIAALPGVVDAAVGSRCRSGGTSFRLRREGRGQGARCR